MADTGNILDQLKVSDDQKQKLNDIERKRAKLAEDDAKNLTEYERTLDQMISGKTDVQVSQLSKLDEGIERGRKFKGEISDLAISLTTELNELGQFFGDINQYKGRLERSLGYFEITRRMADRLRMSRVTSADMKENLQTILDYGTHMVKKLHDAILENMECYVKIDATIVKTAKTLRDTQPIYEHWRAAREDFERQSNELQTRMDKADQTEFAALSVEKAALDKRLHEAKTNEDYNFTIVKKTKEALPVQKTHLKAYSDLRDSLIIMKAGLEKDIESVTQLYMAVPTAVKTALGTKAASTYDKGMKYATDAATSTLLQSVRGVTDEVAGRQERPLIEAERLEAYRKLQLDMETEFNGRMEALKRKHASATAE
jgi:hypothetical protein